MKRLMAVLTLVGIAATTLLVAHNATTFRATLRGWQEVPSVSTIARGRFDARINEDGSAVEWLLRYSDLEGTVTQAHVHLADVDVNGGIAVWLCSNLTSPPTPAGEQACPAPPATISGTFTALDVVGPSGQGIDPGQLTEFVEAIRRGLTYANVHSTRFPGGEVRGQVAFVEP